MPMLEMEMKSGYVISVASWENDGDNRSTIMLDGLTKNELEFYKKVFPYFRSKSNNTELCLGNMGDHELHENVYGRDMTGEEMIVRVGKKIYEYAKEFGALSDWEACHSDDEYYDFVREFAPTFLGTSEYYEFRVFDYAEWAFVENDTTFSLIDTKVFQEHGPI